MQKTSSVLIPRCFKNMLQNIQTTIKKPKRGFQIENIFPQNTLLCWMGSKWEHIAYLHYKYADSCKSRWKTISSALKCSVLSTACCYHLLPKHAQRDYEQFGIDLRQRVRPGKVSFRKEMWQNIVTGCYRKQKVVIFHFDTLELALGRMPSMTMFKLAANFLDGPSNGDDSSFLL